MSGIPIWHPGEPLEPLQACLDRGGVLVVPTESSYGLAADPASPQGVATVFRIKERPPGKPLPVVVADRRQLRRLGADFSDPRLQALAAAWPAALSLLVPVDPPMVAAAGQPRVAVRVPAREELRAMLRDLDRPLTATSANRAGETPYTDPAAAAALVADFDAWVVDGGELPGGLPSTLVGVEGGEVRILREGLVTSVEVAGLVNQGP